MNTNEQSPLTQPLLLEDLLSLRADPSSCPAPSLPDALSLFPNQLSEAQLRERIERALQRGTPDHVAIIMDGNRRWAKARGQSAYSGHHEGAKRLTDLIEQIPRLEIGTLTLYAFSTENWQRSATEVRLLLKILEQYLQRYGHKMCHEGVRLQVIGDRARLPLRLQKLILDVEERTRAGRRLHCLLALSYGGRDEIVRAVKRLHHDLQSEAHSSSEVQALRPSLEQLDEDSFARYLDTGGVRDPDLLIRTSGEGRISNFLLWQLAYAEFVSLPVMWPDFTLTHLLHAVELYQDRQRRFGQ